MSGVDSRVMEGVVEDELEVGGNVLLNIGIGSNVTRHHARGEVSEERKWVLRCFEDCSLRGRCVVGC